MTKNKVHVKKGDTVVVLAGKSVGQKGKVISVIPAKMQVLVEGANFATKHKKPRKQEEQGGIQQQEAPIHCSNVMLVCPKCSVPTRIGKEIMESGDKYRKCKKCGETIDQIGRSK